MAVTLPVLRVRLLSVPAFGRVLLVSTIALLAVGCATNQPQVRQAPVVVAPEPVTYVEPAPVHKTETRMAAVPQLQFMPVKGVTQKQIRNNFGEHRNGGRTHKGIDIFAPSGRELLAVTSGYIERTSSKLGGNSVYLRGDNGLTYYYAHLSRYHPKARSGERVDGGMVIGYVGNTGNARSTPAHLHFEIRKNGVPFNPYYTLRDPDMVVTPLGSSTPVEYADYRGGATAPDRVGPAKNSGGEARASASASSAKVTKKSAKKSASIASKKSSRSDSKKLAAKKSASKKKLAAKKSTSKKKLAARKAATKKKQYAKKAKPGKKKYASR